jgi:hypothetical protein
MPNPKLHWAPMELSIATKADWPTKGLMESMQKEIGDTQGRIFFEVLPIIAMTFTLVDGTIVSIKGYIFGSAVTTTACAAVSTTFVFIYAVIGMIATFGGQ